jgi:hypothetical protein
MINKHVDNSLNKYDKNKNLKEDPPPDSTPLIDLPQGGTWGVIDISGDSPLREDYHDSHNISTQKESAHTQKDQEVSFMKELYYNDQKMNKDVVEIHSYEGKDDFIVLSAINKSNLTIKCSVIFQSRNYNLTSFFALKNKNIIQNFNNQKPQKFKNEKIKPSDIYEFSFILLPTSYRVFAIFISAPLGVYLCICNIYVCISGLDICRYVGCLYKYMNIYTLNSLIYVFI